jgi:hypothetical protein
MESNENKMFDYHKFLNLYSRLNTKKSITVSGFSNKKTVIHKKYYTNAFYSKIFRV